MSSEQVSFKCALQRTRTWPLHAAKSNKALATVAMSSSEGVDGPAVVIPKQPSPGVSDSDEDIDANPGQHFLSPVHAYEYDDWSDDSESDSDSIEWDAGITDFALFDSDRRRAQDTGASLPDKWHGLVSNQESALQRSMARTQAWSDSNDLTGALPALTPDASPHLDDVDDIEPVANHPIRSRPHDLALPTITVSAPSPIYRKVTTAEIEDAMLDFEDDDDGLVLAFRKEDHAPLQRRNQRVQRPGLAKNRTLSGRAHSWRRPGLHIGTVVEDPRAESQAERKDSAASVASPSAPIPIKVQRQLAEEESTDTRWMRRGAVQISWNSLSQSV